ncbi:MAG: hypothetical protein WCK47_07200 [bacterium]|nr:hypothetical protein [Candidatus Sumerlaeota bacterium]
MSHIIRVIGSMLLLLALAGPECRGGQMDAVAAAASQRDLRVGVDIIDTLSGGPLRDLEKGNFLLDRIEVRVYDAVPD